MSASAVNNESKPIRRRAGHSKSRTGCRTCKLRKLKCDEAHPICRRCRVADRECILDESIASKPSSQTIVTSGSMTSSRAYATLCLKHFLEHTLPDFKKSEPSMIWRYIEQQLDSDNSLRHTAIALGHEHRLAVSPHKAPSEGSALYVNAVTALRETIAAAELQESPEKLFKIVFNCLLLVVLQCYRKSFDDLNVHLQHGLSIAVQAATQTPADNLAHLQACFRLLKQYSLAVALFNPLLPQHAVTSGTASFTINQALSDPDSLKVANATSEAMHDDQTLLDEEGNLLLDLIRTSVTLRKPHMSHDTSQVTLLKPPVSFDADDTLIAKVDEFRRRHHILLDAINHRKSRAKTKARVAYFEMAEVRYALMGVYIRRRWSGYSCAMDVEAEVFRHCVDKMESLLHRTTELAFGEQSSSSSFGTGLGYVPSLFYVVVMCHEPEVRHKALSLLAECPQQDGPWDAQLVRRICAAIVSHEEKLAREDGNGFMLTGHIPEHCRVAHYYFYTTSDAAETVTTEYLRVFRKHKHRDEFIGETLPLRTG